MRQLLRHPFGHLPGSIRRPSRGSLRLVTALAALAVVAVGLIPSALAGGVSDKKFEPCLQYIGTSPPSPGTCSAGDVSLLPAGSRVQLRLTLHNVATTQSLGSVDLVAPASTTIDTDPSSIGLPAGATLAVLSSSEIEVHDLNLAPDSSATVTFFVTTPCAGTELDWTIAGKQSNDFHGKKNDFLPVNASGLTSSVNGGCRLEWVTQPKSAVVGTVITGTPYDSTGPTVTVEAVGGDGQLLTSASGTVTLTKSAGTFTSSGGGGFSGTTATLSGGQATFPSFQSDRTGAGFTFFASSPGFTDSPNSDAFDIVLSATNCQGQDPCTSSTVQLGSNTTGQATAEGGNFDFLAINTQDFGTPEGCQTFSSVGAAPIIVKDQRTTASGDLLLTYGVDKAQIDARYGSNQGKQFFPLCLGTRRMVEQPDGSVVAVPCYEKINGLDQSGWKGLTLNSDGKFDSTATELSTAVCDDTPTDPGYGYFFGIVGSFQSYTDPNPNLRIDPSWNPTVVSWSSDTNHRYFVIRLPAASGPGGSGFENVPWDPWGRM